MYELWSSSLRMFSILLRVLLGPDLLLPILLSTIFQLQPSFNDSALFHSHIKQQVKSVLQMLICVKVEIAR
jgi:hypothetical protein